MLSLPYNSLSFFTIDFLKSIFEKNSEKSFTEQIVLSKTTVVLQ